MKTSHTAFLALAAMASAACGGESLDWAGTITDSAGITIVGNPSEGAWTESSRWSVEDALMIGTAEGDPDYQFGQISGIGLSSDGRIFVLDQQASEVRVFNPEGVLENKFGRTGSGPGELSGQGSGPLFVGAGDTVLVPDLANQRVVRFSVDGEPLGSYRVELTDGIPVRWELNQAGRLVSQIRHIPLPGQTEEPDTMDAIIERGSDGAVLDTLLTIPAGRSFSAAGGRMEMRFFSAEPAWALGPDAHVYFGVNNEYRIGVYDREAQLRRVIVKDFPPEEVTGEDQEIFTNALEKAWRDAGVPAAAVGQLLSGVSFESVFPAYLQMMGGPAQTLWVQHLSPPHNLSEDERENLNPQLGFGMGGRDWDVFDSEGRYLGIVTMPDKYQPIRFVGSNIYGVWRDELDVQYVLKVAVIGVPTRDTGALPIGGG